ncbi:MAG TPA: hypothetical protein VFS70_03380 [Actinomycetota bacterium]|nr:hypothetical protein [Actinomycetota bacterium]
MARTRFRDRAEAGDVLAGLLGHYAGRDDVLVLGLPRGGVDDDRVGKAWIGYAQPKPPARNEEDDR